MTVRHEVIHSSACVTEKKTVECHQHWRVSRHYRHKRRGVDQRVTNTTKTGIARAARLTHLQKRKAWSRYWAESLVRGGTSAMRSYPGCWKRKKYGLKVQTPCGTPLKKTFSRNRVDLSAILSLSLSLSLWTHGLKYIHFHSSSTGYLESVTFLD